MSLALQNVAPSEGKTLDSLLSNIASNGVDPMKVQVNSQNVMAALTLGLSFPQVHIFHALIAIFRHANPSSFQPLGSARAPPRTTA